MSPLSAIAVTRLAGQAVVTAGRVATHSVERFAEVFAETAKGGAASDSGSADDVKNIGQSIIERIRGLLAQASLPTDQPLTLELSPLGDIYASGAVQNRGIVEGALDSDSQLRDLLGRWSSLTGQARFEYGGPSPETQHSR